MKDECDEYLMGQLEANYDKRDDETCNAGVKGKKEYTTGQNTHNVGAFRIR